MLVKSGFIELITQDMRQNYQYLIVCTIIDQDYCDMAFLWGRRALYRATLNVKMQFGSLPQCTLKPTIHLSSN